MLEKSIPLLLFLNNQLIKLFAPTWAINANVMESFGMELNHIGFNMKKLKERLLVELIILNYIQLIGYVIKLIVKILNAIAKHRKTITFMN